MLEIKFRRRGRARAEQRGVTSKAQEISECSFKQNLTGCAFKSERAAGQDSVHGHVSLETTQQEGPRLLWRLLFARLREGAARRGLTWAQRAGRGLYPLSGGPLGSSAAPGAEE